MQPVRARRSAKKGRSSIRKKDVSRKGKLYSEATTLRSRRRTKSRVDILIRYWNSIREASVVGRPMLLLTLLLVIAGGGTGLFAGGHVTAALERLREGTRSAFVAAGFSVEQIVLDGNERTSADAIYQALGIETGVSIFAADPNVLRGRLRELPWVADAAVRRRFPDQVSVTLFEKRPFALWQSGGTLAVIERSGAVITGVDPNRFARLPLLMGRGAPEAAAPLVDALGGQRAVGARLRGLERVSERRWDLLLESGVRVRLPEQGWESELADLEWLIVERAVLERNIEIIDLRFPDSYIFQLHNGDSQPVSRDRPV